MKLLTKAEAIALIQKAQSLCEASPKDFSDLLRVKPVRIIVLK